MQGPPQQYEVFVAPHWGTCSWRPSVKSVPPFLCLSQRHDCFLRADHAGIASIATCKPSVNVSGANACCCSGWDVGSAELRCCRKAQALLQRRMAKLADLQCLLWRHWAIVLGKVPTAPLRNLGTSRAEKTTGRNTYFRYHTFSDMNN